MWRFPRLLMRKTGTCMKQATATYKHWVMNETLAQLTRACYDPCCSPRIPPQKVTVVGAGTDVGRIACLLLKQQPLINILAMYDVNPQNNVVGVATDIAHIDTTTTVEVYQGRDLLPAALFNADVVLICGGYYTQPPTCCMLDHELFFHNMQHVRFACMAAAHFCPYAVIAIQTPPIDCNFTLAKYTLKKYQAYNPRRLLGINAITSMRANQLLGNALNSDPTGSYVPIICGGCKCTRVPVFSATTNYWCLKSDDKQFIMRILREGDDLVCRVKSNYEQAHLSIGFSTARFIVNVMQGLFAAPAFIDSAFIEQPNPSRTFNEKYFASPVTMGWRGIESVEIPKLDQFERELVEYSKVDLQDLTNLGRCYGIGETYKIHRGKFFEPYDVSPCPVCKPCDQQKPRIEAKSCGCS